MTRQSRSVRGLAIGRSHLIEVEEYSSKGGIRELDVGVASENAGVVLRITDREGYVDRRNESRPPSCFRVVRSDSGVQINDCVTATLKSHRILLYLVAHLRRQFDKQNSKTQI